MLDSSPPSATRLLIVEDDPEVGTGLEEFFTLKGYHVSRVDDGKQGLQEITSLPPYDLVILDVMLPHKSGFEILREARQSGVDSPVIMLTVKASEDDKLRGFKLGADDYVTKPFDAEELAARVQAVLERSHQDGEADDSFSFGDVEVEFSSETAQRNGETIEFTTLEFDILEYFIEHRGRTVSRKQLLRDVWGISGDITTRTIDRHVASLRKKIEPDPTDPTYIETVYGIGYKFSV
ncbi:DNA-binding response regulator [Longimonas halophila]|uniref:Phosphate regulon transcriptional regulatory protein PhoB n=1 Tax=Longimonas halophila TaxID=1469170 RepID=A0A2H3NIK1_9BACT|nr:response regulator transcription factor [Longimonas halophila]PEN05406.1 DNA-binding response regulator [Longimonas halophila]